MWSPRESPTLSAKSLPGGGRQTPPAISPPFQKRQQLHQLGPARSWFIPARTTGKESSQAKAQNPPEPQAPGAARLPPGPTPQLARSGPARAHLPFRPVCLHAQDVGRLPGTPAQQAPRPGQRPCPRSGHGSRRMERREGPTGEEEGSGAREQGAGGNL